VNWSLAASFRSFNIATPSTWFPSGLCSPGRSCGPSLCRSPGAAAAAEAPWDTGGRTSWAEPWCGTAEADCYSSRCGSRYPGRPRHCPGHPELQQGDRVRSVHTSPFLDTLINTLIVSNL